MKTHREDAEKETATFKQPINPVLKELIEKHIPDVIWELNLTEQKFTYISPSVYQLRGLTVDEAMQEDFRASLHKEDYQYIVNHLQPRVSHFEKGDETMKVLTGEYRQPRKDGSYVDVEITTILIKNQQGKVDRIAGISREITHRKSQKELLRNTQSLFETVFNFTATGIALVNEDGTFINVNNGFCKMLGYPMEYVMEKTLTHFLVKGDEPFIRDLFKSANKEKGLEKQAEIRMVNIREQIIWGLINITAVQSYLDTKTQWVIQIQETTQRKKAEEVIRLLNADLKIKNREMEQLVFITSHDLRSPLVNIKGFSGELQYSLKEIIKLYKEYDFDGLAGKILPVEKEIYESFEYINLSIEKMDRLLKGLLAYSRLGRKVKDPAAIDMHDLVTEVIKTNEYQLKNSHIIIEVSQLPNCWGSEQMINQAFSNLLSNAIKYRDNTRKCIIKISGEQTENSVTYCMEDNGMGIESRHHEKVFELFYRLYPEKGDGEGLGLSTVKKIIELNSGQIRMESEPGKGTKFFVTLPRENSYQINEQREQISP